MVNRKNLDMEGINKKNRTRKSSSEVYKKRNYRKI